MPYRIAFVQADELGWTVFYYFIDVCFLIDIILTFNTTFTLPDTMLEVKDRRTIVSNYLQGWFFLDIIAILPFDKFFQSANGAENFNAVARFARIGRLYKIIRMTRLAKLFKILKSKNTIMTQFSTKLRIDHG